MSRFTVFAVVLAALSLAVPSQAGTIGINFTNGAETLTSSQQPGIVAGANWNNAIGNTGTNLSLVDSTGASSGAVLTYTATSAYDAFGLLSTANAATNTLYAGGLGGDNVEGEVQITLTNIPYAAYEIITYASQDTFVGATLSITDGSTTYYYKSNGSYNGTATTLLETLSTDPNNPTVGQAQYQIFSGLSGSSATLTTAGSITDVLSNNVFGLQIEQTPEPGSWVMMGSGLGLLLFLGRRARRA